MSLVCVRPIFRQHAEGPELQFRHCEVRARPVEPRPRPELYDWELEPPEVDVFA